MFGGELIGRRSGFSFLIFLFAVLIWSVLEMPRRQQGEPLRGTVQVSVDPATSAEQVAAVMLSWHSLELVSLRKVQVLWAGYGHICQVTARATTAAAAEQMRDSYGDIGTPSENGTDTYALVLKLISPPPTSSKGADEGHLRKILSYQVEQEFYSSIAPKLRGDSPMACCIAATQEEKPGSGTLEGLTATLMTDLRGKYPVAGEKRAVLNETQVLSALDWLSRFHRKSWEILPLPLQELLLPPLEEAERRKRGDAQGRSVWLNGGYTYLATRRKEYASLAADSDSEWSSVLCQASSPYEGSLAEKVAHVLTPRGRDHETLIHGDVKSENLFTTQSGSEVAFYDFQYVGLGLGVCDLAKLFTCSVPLHMLVDDDGPARLQMGEGEKKLLERYRDNLLAATGKQYDWDTFVRHWETALVDWLRFQASWGFWGNTEWLEARVRWIVEDQDWKTWLDGQQRLPN
ncbi:kinase-like domain-containing protein [Astrocystis sublimbata]|nr:kinase-like domain-containing protein [Astrocystis sublimbata]